MNHWIIGPVASIEADDWVDAAPLDQRGRLCDFELAISAITITPALNTSSLVGATR
jgi:hypothetical protein